MYALDIAVVSVLSSTSLGAVGLFVTLWIHHSANTQRKEQQAREDQIRTEERAYARRDSTWDHERRQLIELNAILSDIEDAASAADTHAEVSPNIMPALMRMRALLATLGTGPGRDALDRCYEVIRNAGRIGWAVSAAGPLAIVLGACDQARSITTAWLRDEPIPDHPEILISLYQLGHEAEWPTAGTGRPEFETAELILPDRGLPSGGTYTFLKPWRDRGARFLD